MTREQALDRARKLLNKAADPATSEAEHDSFTAKALSIMRAHGIRMYELMDVRPPLDPEPKTFTFGEKLIEGTLRFIDLIDDELISKATTDEQIRFVLRFLKTRFQRPASRRHGRR